jgi:hypothetical protein
VKSTVSELSVKVSVKSSGELEKILGNMLELLGKCAKIGSENGDFGHESHPFRHILLVINDI